MVIKDICSGIVILIFCLLGRYSTAQLESGGDHVLYGPGFFPNMFLSVLAIGAAILLVRGIYTFIRSPKVKNRPKDNDIENIVKMVSFACLTAAYIIIFQFTGFISSTILFLILAQLLYGRKQYLSTIIVSILGSTATYLVLAILFEVPLPLIFES